MASNDSALTLDEEALTTLRVPADPELMREPDFVNALEAHGERLRRGKPAASKKAEVPSVHTDQRLVKRVASQLIQLPVGEHHLNSKSFSTGRTKRSAVPTLMTRGSPLKRNAGITGSMIMGQNYASVRPRESAGSIGVGVTPMTGERDSSQEQDASHDSDYLITQENARGSERTASGSIERDNAIQPLL